MTFILKTFEELEKKFNDAVEARLVRDNKTQISELDEPRKSEFQFLQSVFKVIRNNLDVMIQRNKSNNKITPTTTLEYYSSIVYGAMFIAIKDIENNLTVTEKITGSTLYNSLCHIMGTEKTSPSPSQLKNCHRDINKFLSQIFKKNDSRQGFAEQFELKSLTLTKLVTFASIGYELEKEANKREIKQLKSSISEEISVDETKPFKLPRTISMDLTARYNSWKNLTDLFNSLVNTELGRKNAYNINKLSPKRQAQIEFLHSIISYLSEIKPEKMANSDKMAVLLGAMYLVRGDIAHYEYGYVPLTKEKVVSKFNKPSVFHEGLTNILNSFEKTSLEEKIEIKSVTGDLVENIELFVNATQQFLRYLTIERLKDKDGLIKDPTIRTKHLFSTINGFNLIKYLELGQEMIHDCRFNALKECEAIEIKKLPPKEQPKGYLSSLAENYIPFSIWGRPSSSELTPKEEDLEAIFNDIRSTII